MTVSPSIELFGEGLGALEIAGFETRGVERHHAAGDLQVRAGDGLQARVRLERLAGEDGADTRRFGVALLGIAALYIDVVDVAGGADGEQGQHARAFDLRENRREGVGVVGRGLEAADGVLVESEVDVGGERLAFVGFEEDEGQFRIDGPGRPGDIRIELSGIPADGAVLHEVAAVEADGLFASLAEGGARRRQPGLCEAYAFGDLARQFGAVAFGSFEIAAVGAGARAAIGDERAGVAVSRADHHVGGRYAGGALDEFARFFDDGGRNADKVAGHERDLLAGGGDHDCLGVQIVVDAGGEAGGVVSRHRRAGGRADGDLGGAGAKSLGRDQGSAGQQNQQRSHPVIVTQNKRSCAAADAELSRRLSRQNS